ncbi:hypothetical protein [Sphingomonas abaci]|uniref:Uncharacterized protein n=1 Tax=Sphingomonas abaci TaxID=237611 RepID=A0A7W7EWA3_9SPHN|nr:hypothetical protein [Sphingomonas abaci]MBB4616322.1 hypothetical protein [Sphingomonas abaci]
MTQATDDERRLLLIEAERLGLIVPPAAIAGVVANQRLLARHYDVVHGALADEAP